MPLDSKRKVELEANTQKEVSFIIYLSCISSQNSLTCLMFETHMMLVLMIIFCEQTMQMRQKLYCKRDQGPQADVVLAAANHQTEIKTGFQ